MNHWIKVQKDRFEENPEFIKETDTNPDLYQIDDLQNELDLLKTLYSEKNIELVQTRKSRKEAQEEKYQNQYFITNYDILK